ncbi:hypothetical protein JCM8097_008960 [Rhodosporidiobolus ruineniae]
MQTLHLHTADLSSASSGAAMGDFAVLPSPSTFNLGSSYASAQGDWGYSSTLYDAHSPSEAFPAPFKAGHASHPSFSSTSSSSSLADAPSPAHSHGWSTADDHSSPASSRQATPTASPLVAPKAVTVVQPDCDPLARFDAFLLDDLKEADTPDFGKHLEFAQFGAAKTSRPPTSIVEDQHQCYEGDMMYTHQNGGQVGAASPPPSSFLAHPTTNQLPSPALSAASASVGGQQQQLYGQQSVYSSSGAGSGQPPTQVQQPYFASPAPAANSVYLADPNAAAPQVVYQQQQQQQQQVAYAPMTQPAQLVTINGITYAMAMPVAAPAPAAIETPHGTYFFVPAAAAPPTQTQQVHQHPDPNVPSSSSFVLSSGLPAPVAASIPGFAPLTTPSPPVAQQGVPTTLSMPLPPVPASSAPSLNMPLGSSVGSGGGEQKIRLPVGQGKRGSTKRAPKKDQVKRFICPFGGCGRAFARNFNMQSHYRSHLGVRDFDCPHCPKKFSRRHDRARHCAAVHDSHVDRDGQILSGPASLNGSASASGSPSSSAGYDDHDEHEHEHDELSVQVDDYGVPVGHVGVDGFDYSTFAQVGGSSFGSL